MFNAETETEMPMHKQREGKRVKRQISGIAWHGMAWDRMG
jgi:hypothetical protein